MNEFASKVLSYCEANGLLDFDGIVIGLSGGPDSMALAGFLLELRREGFYNGVIAALHVNHNLRPGDCDRDEEFVSAFCAENDIRLKIISSDVKAKAAEDKRTVEEEGRIIRYRAFIEYAEELGEEYNGRFAVATAHHGDDLAETFMMNLFRGSGLEGLCGMKALSGNIIRPLLCVDKNEIMEYLGDTPYCVDITNSGLDHTRNVWRNKIMPMIGEVSVKRPNQAVRSTSSLLACDSDFITGEMYRVFDLCKTEVRGRIFLDASRLASYHMAIVSRVIRHLYLYIAGSLKDFEQVNLDRAYVILRSPSSVREDMPFGIVCFNVSGLFGFTKKDDTGRVFDLITELKGFVTAPEGTVIRISREALKNGFASKIPDSSLQISGRIIENCDNLEYNDYSWFCPMESVSGDIVISNSLCAARFCKAGGTGSKQISRIFTDLKIPRESRDRIMGVTAGDEVCFIPGIGHSRGFVSGSSRLKCGILTGNLLKVEFK
ncbi:MAG: tRNA lysidine(34) synthetase TilS [Clostridiales bacterium]|nr:tRNA lysidine(34) synthetase TilS [Clostridiales bacterium]